MGYQIFESRLSGGRWTGHLRYSGGSSDAPSVGVFLREEDLGDAVVSPVDAGVWRVEFTIPAETLDEGTSTFLFVDRMTGEMLGRFCIVAGGALELDVLAQVDALRAELDQLKSAFRREMRRTIKKR